MSARCHRVRPDSPTGKGKERACCTASRQSREPHEYPARRNVAFLLSFDIFTWQRYGDVHLTVACSISCGLTSTAERMNSPSPRLQPWFASPPTCLTRNMLLQSIGFSCTAAPLSSESRPQRSLIVTSSGPFVSGVPHSVRDASIRNDPDLSILGVRLQIESSSPSSVNVGATPVDGSSASSVAQIQSDLSDKCRLQALLAL